MSRGFASLAIFCSLVLVVACGVETDSDIDDTSSEIKKKGQLGDACGEGGAKKCAKDLFCQQAVIGDCPDDAGFSGVCSIQPEFCIAVFDPVCGCDGQTYGNLCEAYREGVNVAHDGACAGTTCQSNLDCAATDYCAADSCGATGACQPRPEACPAVFDPVCGCDGVTYGNGCEAARAGQNVAHDGPCLVVGACTSNADCAPDQYCFFVEGTCGPAGACQPRPELCIQVFDPVCGCNDVTYSNSCVAASNGQSVAHQGECTP